MLITLTFGFIRTGAVAEQFVGQELTALEGVNRDPGLYYWDRTARGSTAEVDYLIAIHGRVVPVEVKAGAFGHLKSLHLFLSTYPSIPFGVKASEQNFARSGRIMAVPLYSLSHLGRIVSYSNSLVASKKMRKRKKFKKMHF